MNILVACAVAEELGSIVLPDSVDLLITGLGPVEASIAVTQKLATRAAGQHSAYDILINVGIAGAFPNCGVALGSGVIVVEEQYVDLGREDRSPLNLPSGSTLHDTLLIDLSILPKIALLQEAFARLDAHWGAGVSSATITTSEARANNLLKCFPRVLVESMEGFAIARVAASFQTPFLELRGIANRVGDRALAGWDFQAGVNAATALLHEVLSIYGAIASP